MKPAATGYLPVMNSDRTLSLEPRHGAVRAARRFVEQALVDWCVSSGHEVLLASHELVANAVIHAGLPVQLRLRYLPGRIRVEVTDADPNPPRQLTIDNHSSPSGRGILIVSRIAECWGVEPAPEGKRVWAELPLAAAHHPAGV